MLSYYLSKRQPFFLFLYLCLVSSVYANDVCTSSYEDANESLCESLCEQRDYDACVSLGEIYLSKRQYFFETQALELFHEACDNKNATGCFWIAEELYYKDDHMDEALPYFIQACEYGDIESCSVLGWCYEEGEYVIQDMEKAREYYQRSCDLGSDLICELKNLERND